MKRIKINGHEIAYIDEGHGSTIIFVHGTPVSSSEFEEVIQRLKGSFRCIAIDHLGFGESDKPADADYSLKTHRDRLKKFLSQLGVEKYHLVVSDFGGPIAIPAAAENWKDVLSLTVMNSWAWSLQETQPKLASTRWLMTSWLMKFLYLKFNFSARVILKSAWGSYRPLTKARHHFYMSKFKTSSERLGTLGFLNSLFNTADPTWQIHHSLHKLPEKPVLIIWGLADKFISSSNLGRWKEIFPHAEIHELEKVGHFVSEEAPEQVAKYILKFLSNSNHLPIQKAR